jgi:hypothetical protein
MNIIPEFYELNKNQCDKFINASDKEVREICKKIIKNTLHVDFFTFILQLNIIINNFLKFYTNKRPIFLYSYNDEKSKSNFWILHYVIKYIKKNSTFEIVLVDKSLINSKLKEDDIIIFVDDCIYLGEQMSTTLKSLQQFHDKYKFFVMVPYISHEAKVRLEQLFISENIGNIGIKRTRKEEKIMFPDNIIEIPCINKFLNHKESELLEKYYNGGEEEFINARNTYLVYFDHKLADMYSVPTIIYLGVVPNKKNSNFLSRVEDDNLDKFKQHLDIIPIINNCHKFEISQLKLNLLSPQCPNPPYKRTYEDFNEKFKNLKLEKTQRSLPLSIGNNNRKQLKSYSLKKNRSL